MNTSQLLKIEEFCRPYYKRTGRWHAWDHAVAVKKLATKIVKEEVKEADILVVQAASIVHDIGRSVKDEGHAEESAKIIKPFLKEIGVSEEDSKKIVSAVACHDIERIDSAKYVEANVVFDADKIEILSVYGFMRVASWLIEERNMEMGKALRFLDKYCQRFRSKLYSNYAKGYADKQYKQINDLLELFYEYEGKWRNE